MSGPDRADEAGTVEPDGWVHPLMAYVWTISVQVVQIHIAHIAISVVWEVGRLARCIRVD